MRSPPEQFEHMTISRFGRLREPLACLKVMQAQSARHRPADIRFSILLMRDQGSPLDPQGERAAFSPAFSAFLLVAVCAVAGDANSVAPCRPAVDYLVLCGHLRRCRPTPMHPRNGLPTPRPAFCPSF